jgi:hypothetical protein
VTLVTRALVVARRCIGPLAIVAAFATLVLVPGIPPLCPMRTAFGWSCPGCGMTRAMALALHGRFVEATAMFPLWFVVAPFVAFVFAVESWTYVRTGRAASVVSSGIGMRLALGLAAALVAVWVARFFGAFGGPAPV